MNTYRFKIFGAGSIGNHLAHAARCLGWEVVVCDLDPAALRRMREEIYPTRYGQWDAAIGLHHVDEAPLGGFDLIAVGTPPDTHLPVALASMTAKYLRELAMIRLNRFFREALPEIKPTAGYVQDGRRFLQEVRPVIEDRRLQAAELVRKA